jgi:predicted ester cyclase
MKNQASQAVVQRFYDEVFTQKKMALLSELFDPNLVIHDLDFGGVLPGGGLEGTLAAFPDVVATVNLWVVQDDLVTAYVTYNATHQAAFLGVPATGKAVTWSIIDIWRVQAGKIVELWHHIPNEDILEQITGKSRSQSDA